MKDDARRGGGVSTCSDSTHAKALGVCRQTIRRWKCQLEREGSVHRDGYHVWNPRCRTVRYRVHVTQGIKGFSPSGLKTYRYVRTNAFGCATKRGEMELEPRQRGELEQREHTAQDVVRTLCDAFAAESIPIHPRHKGIIAKQAKESLDAGYQFETVVIAGATALRRGQPQNLHFIINDLVMAGAGKYMTRREYEKALQDEMELR